MSNKGLESRITPPAALSVPIGTSQEMKDARRTLHWTYKTACLHLAVAPQNL